MEPVFPDRVIDRIGFSNPGRLHSEFGLTEGGSSGENQSVLTRRKGVRRGTSSDSAYSRLPSSDFPDHQ
jgi:hypothetical protein